MHKRLYRITAVILLLIITAVSVLAVRPYIPELTDPVALNNLGYRLFENGDHALAEGVFRRAIAIDPSYVTARENLAVVLNAQEKFDEAAEHLRVLVALDAQNPQYWYDMGVNKIAQFRYVTNDRVDFYDGLAAYKRAASINPNYAHVQENLAVLARVGAEYGLMA